MTRTPPTPLRFVKMHGAGNDFVVIDSRRARGPVMTPALARAMGDRHRGVGFDQLAELRDDAGADAALHFWNADGTTAGACGNATRCVAARLMDERGVSALSLRSERGILHAQKRPDGMIAVNMGPPQLGWSEIPLSHAADPLHLPLPGDPAAVGMGNPHCILVVPDADAIDLGVRGPALERDPLFPQRTNVEFVHVIAPGRLRMRVWERGTGVTLACGSGACAVAVAAHLRGFSPRAVAIEADGGTLEVDWRDDGVWLSGPVAHVFDGTWSPG